MFIVDLQFITLQERYDVLFIYSLIQHISLLRPQISTLFVEGILEILILWPYEGYSY